jgi:hypothetical protein
MFFHGGKVMDMQSISMDVEQNPFNIFMIIINKKVNNLHSRGYWINITGSKGFTYLHFIKNEQKLKYLFDRLKYSQELD